MFSVTLQYLTYAISCCILIAAFGKKKEKKKEKEKKANVLKFQLTLIKSHPTKCTRILFAVALFRYVIDNIMYVLVHFLQQI